MSIESTNYINLSYIKEVTAGTTPSTPTFQSLPVIGADISENISTEVSNAIRSDRMTDAMLPVDSEISGTIDFELSYEAYKPLLTSLMQNGAASNVSVTATDISFSTAGTITTVGENWTTEGIVVGQFIGVTGATNATNNKVYKVTSKTNTVLTVTPVPGVNETAGASVTVKGSMIRNGASTADSYTFRKKIDGPSNGNAIFYYRGVQVGALNLNFSVGSILSGGLTLSGLSGEGTATAISGESVTDVASYELLNSSSSIAQIQLSGFTSGTSVSSASFNIDNQINAAKAVGTFGAAALASWKLQATVDIEIYFQDLTQYNAFKNNSDVSISIVSTDTIGNSIVISYPRCNFESLTHNTGGGDQFLMESGTLRALRDPSTNCAVQFDFIDA